jgi:hypothetical protein
MWENSSWNMSAVVGGLGACGVLPIVLGVAAASSGGSDSASLGFVFCGFGVAFLVPAVMIALSKVFLAAFKGDAARARRAVVLWSVVGSLLGVALTAFGFGIVPAYRWHTTPAPKAGIDLNNDGKVDGYDNAIGKYNDISGQSK